MKLNNDKFFKDFKPEYLLFLDKKYEDKSISYIKSDIKEQSNNLKIKKGLKILTIRNVEYWTIRGWSLDEANIKIKEIKNNWKKPKYSNLNLEYWLDRGFTEIEAKENISKIQRSRSNKAIKTRMNNENYTPPLSPFTEKYWTNKGITDKNEIDFKIKSQRKLNIEYWINKGFDIEESVKKVSEFQNENNNKRKNKWLNNTESYEYKKLYNTKIEYYLDKGYTLDESEELLKERQTTFTIDKCIKKYGYYNGNKIFKNRQSKWIKKMFNETTCMSTGRSLIADKFINNLIDSINDDIITQKFLYGINEIFIYDNIIKKANRYDLCYNNKIIEFNGDFWHSNPKIFKPDDIHKIKKIKCSDIWKLDNRKIELAKEHNYDVLIIWESEYINNETEIINKCKKFLINEN